MIKQSPTILLLLIIAIALTSCASSRAPAAIPTMGVMLEEKAVDMQVAPAAPAAPLADYAAEADSGRGLRAYTAETAERIVIKNAELSIVVDDPGQAMTTISRMAEDMGGFVVNSNLYKTRTSEGLELPEARITVRVPAASLNDALDKIKALVNNPDEDIRYENVSGSDVTQEYTDLKSRLFNLEETEKQLREIMASATKTEDVMMVFNQLTQVREQIEVLKGQIKYYEDSSRLSAINVQLIASASVKPLTIGGWQPAGIARDAIQALINALKFLVNVAIWMVLFFLPLAVLIVAPIWLIIAFIRRRIARRKAARQNSEPPVTPPAKS